MTKSAQLRQVLLEAPMTAIELAALLKITKRDAHVRLWVLFEQGQVECAGFGERDPDVRWSKWPKLWALTAHGRYLAKRDLKNSRSAVKPTAAPTAGRGPSEVGSEAPRLDEIAVP